MKKIIGSMVALLTFAFLSGCVTRGSDFPSQTNWINVDQTNQQEVRARLGEPFSVGRSSLGPSWTYGYYRHTIFGKSLTKELKVSWNEDGTVRSYTFNSSFPEDKDRVGNDQ